MWEERPPAKPRQALHTYVSGLRAVLEPRRGAGQPPAVLRRVAAGYRLDLAPDAVDSGRLASLVRTAGTAAARGCPDEALECAERALALWCGPAFADVGTARFVQSEVGRLTELRTTAREIVLAARLARGEHHLTAAAGEELTADNPLRESAWALRALALHRAGRSAEAVAVLGAARRVLREELGVGPGPELARLTAQILAGDGRALHAATAAAGPR